MRFFKAEIYIFTIFCRIKQRITKSLFSDDGKTCMDCIQC